MLVLSRMVGETVCIGDGLIEVTVVSVRGDKVKLGIAAPDDISVHRLEVQRDIDRKRAQRDAKNS